MAKKKYEEPVPDEEMDALEYESDGSDDETKTIDTTVDVGQVDSPVVPEYGKHILVDIDGTGLYEVVDVTDPLLTNIDPVTGWNRDRRLFYGGTNIEHVSDGPNGVWCYRSM